MIALLLSQWKLLGLSALGLALAGLLVAWRLEVGHAQRLAQQAAAARAADAMDQAKAGASQAATAVTAQGADRDTSTLNLHEENSHALETASGFAQGLDPELNAAGRRGLCGFAAYQSDAACVQLRGADPGQRPQAGDAHGPAAR